MTNEHTSLEKYTSHTLFEKVAKGLCVRGELETEQNATYWPPVPLTIAALLSHFAGTGGHWGPKPSVWSWFSLSRTATRTPTNWPLSVAPGYIIVWHPPASVRDAIPTRPQLKVISSISSTGCTCFLIDGWVEGQYVAEIPSLNFCENLKKQVLPYFVCKKKKRIDFDWGKKRYRKSS